MSDPVLVYKGDELASYGFGDPHPFGLDRHGVFQDELAAANLGDRIEYAQLLHDASEVKVGRPRKDDASGDKDVTLKVPVVKPNTEIPVIEIFLKD